MVSPDSERSSEMPPKKESADVEIGESEINVSKGLVKDKSEVPNLGERKLSLFGAILILSLSMLGVGILSFPMLFRSSGLLAGVVTTVFYGFLTVFSMIFLIKAADCTQKYTFDEIAYAYLGNIGQRIMAWALIFNLTIACCAFGSVFSTTNSQKVRHFAGCMPIDPENPDAELDCAFVTPPWILLVALILIFPILTLKSVSKLAPTTTIAAICLLIGIIMLVVTYIASVVGSGECTPGKEGDEYCKNLERSLLVTEKCIEGVCRRPAKSESFELVKMEFKGALVLVGGALFGYFAQYNLLSVYREMTDPTQIHTVIYVSVLGIGAPLMCLTGFAGATMFGEDVKDNAFDNMNTITGQVVAIIIAFCVIFKLPLVFNLTRDTLIGETKFIFTWLFARMDKDWDYSTASFLTRAGVAFVLCLAVFPLSMIDLAQLGFWNGALASSLVGWIFPAIFLQCIAIYASYDKPTFKTGLISLFTCKGIETGKRRNIIYGWLMNVVLVLCVTAAIYAWLTREKTEKGSKE